MAHDPNKVLLGSTQSSDKEITCHAADPATFKAGYAVRLNSSGALSLTSGTRIGVSLGRSLSDTLKTAVARVGNRIPLRLKTVQGTVKIGDITFTAKAPYYGAASNSITIALLDTLTDGTAEVEFDEDSPLAIVVNIEATVTTALAIKTAIDADPNVSKLVTVVVDGGDDAAPQAAAAATPLAGGSNVAVLGATVKIDATSGEGSADGTDTGAVYLSGLLSGVTEEGTEVPAAVIALPGGF